MISFIIIGRNIEKHLHSCFASVFKVVDENNIVDSEIIYVDSDSTDNSIELAKQNKINQIIKISSGYNAAIARNLGALYSKKDILFFIDGDMEIVSDFFSHAFTNNTLTYPFLTGNFIYQFPDGTKVNYYKKKYPFKQVNLSNGTFLIKRAAWNNIGGMDERFKKAQDFDFILTAEKKGVPLKRMDCLIAKHNTVDYNHPSRLWKMLFDQVYIRSLLYRKHIYNKAIWRILIRREYSIFSLLISMLFLLVFNCWYAIAIYLCSIIIKSIVQKNRPLYEFIIRIPYYFLRDIVCFLGFFFFWPRNKKEIKYEKIL